MMKSIFDKKMNVISGIGKGMKSMMGKFKNNMGGLFGGLPGASLFGGGSGNSGGYGAPAAPSNGYGAPQQQSNGYGAPQQQSNGYDAPQQSNGYDAPQQQSSGYDAPQQQSNGYDAPQQQSNGYDAPQSNSGYGTPEILTPNDGYNSPSGGNQAGYGNAAPANNNYGAAAPDQQGYGGSGSDSGFTQPEINYGGFGPVTTGDNTQNSAPPPLPISGSNSYDTAGASSVDPSVISVGRNPSQNNIDSYGSPAADPIGAAPDSYGSPAAQPIGGGYGSPAKRNTKSVKNVVINLQNPYNPFLRRKRVH